MTTLTAWTHDTNGNLVALNSHGELVAAKHIATTAVVIQWETTCGQWVARVAAIRDGLTLTGAKRRQAVPGSGRLVAAPKKRAWHAPR